MADISNIIEGNKIIAEFVGITFHVNEFQAISGTPFEILILAPNMRYWDERDSDFNLNPYSFLQFHCDWNWLMAAVEKVESIKSNNGRHYIKIIGKSVDISDTDICVFPAERTKIEVTWLSIIQFIKWHSSKPATTP